jgi:hypothetical protein
MNVDSLKEDFYKQWNNNGVAHIKDCVSDLPDWEKILKMLNMASRSTGEHQKFVNPPEFEIPYKNMLAVKKVVYDDAPIPQPKIESDATFFFSLFFSAKDINTRLSESLYNQIKSIDKKLSIESDFNSLKISLSDKFVPYESHSWHTCIIQLKGINHWYLRDKRIDLDETYFLEPGDCLFFKEEVEHKLSNDEPRSSLVGRFTFNEGGNEN